MKSVNQLHVSHCAPHPVSLDGYQYSYRKSVFKKNNHGCLQKEERGLKTENSRKKSWKTTWEDG